MPGAQITNYSLDWQYWDNTESVTVTIQRSSDDETGAEIPVEIALREDLGRSEATALGVTISSDVLVWNVPCSLLLVDEVNVELREGDTITDEGGVLWLVESVTEERVGVVSISWRAVCRRSPTNG